MNSILSIRNLSKTYKNQIILNKVDMNIPKASILALLGPNGSGKTTLLKSILGIIHPTSDSLVKFGLNKNMLSYVCKSRIGYMPQLPNFPPNICVFELLDLLQLLRRQPIVDIEDLIEQFEVKSFLCKTVNELSGGMRQRVNIIQAFMFDNSLFFLDEPTIGLDPHAVYLLKKLIKKRRDKGATILLTSHTMSEVEELCDSLALLINGKVCLRNSPNVVMITNNSDTLENALHRYWTGQYETI